MLTRLAIGFIRVVERVNIAVGRAAMYLFFVLGAILLYSALIKTLGKIATSLKASPSWAWLDPMWFRPPLWSQELAQFSLVGYFMLGGAYSLILGANVRMDLLYSRWSLKTRALVDCVTVFALIFFLGVLLWGGVESTLYALEFGERSRSAWRPYMAPIKITICIGAGLMLLQSVAFLLRDILTLRGTTLPEVTR